MLTQTLIEQIVLLAKQMHEKEESSNHVNLPFYDGLVEKRGNSYSKVLDVLLNISPNGIDNFILPILQTWAAAGSNKELGGLEIMKGQANRGVLDPLYDYQSALIYEFIGDIENAHISYKNIIKRSNNANAHVYSRAAIFFANNNLTDLYSETLNILETLDPYSNELFILKKNENIKFSYTNYNAGICEGVNKAAMLSTTNYLLYSHDDFYFCPEWDEILNREIKLVGHKKFYLSSTQISPIKTLPGSIINHIRFECGEKIEI